MTRVLRSSLFILVSGYLLSGYQPERDKFMDSSKQEATFSHRHENRLIHETSPYLRQHAHNPVDWYSWGSEALERAKKEDKPILLSIGYSACHWCHVMEHESFENEEIARIMNQHFVNIKVDREERPDLDTIYMNYVQMTTGSGGWPMTVFLTPDQVPFFGGTYFPPDDRFGRPGFPKLCLAVADAYKTKKKEIAEHGPEVLKSLREMNQLSPSGEKLNLSSLHSAFQNLAQRFDMTHGGFAGAPKFPGSMNLSFCLRYFRRTGEKKALDFVELSLEKMAHGGMYDQLGGGFHRYSVDDHWLVPHFEKMLYDNALLSRVYLEAYQLTGKALYRRIAEEVLDYIKREMTSPEGGFYSTQDADSEGEEGKFFVWTPDEVNRILGEKEGSLFCLYYDITPRGNFEGKNILNVPRSLEDVAQATKTHPEELQAALARSRQRLFEEREKRIKPHRDEKILTSWNGLMLVSFVRAACVLQRKDYLDVALKNAQFLLKHLSSGNKLLRTYKDGKSKLNGYLEDYSNFVEGLIALYETTGEKSWLDQALAFNEVLLEQFWDEAGKGFFLTGKDHEELIARVKDFYDNATPAGSSVAVFNLLKLAILVGDQSYRTEAEANLELMSAALTRYPSGFGYLLEAGDFYLGPVHEIAVVGRPQDLETHRLLEKIYQQYLPNKVVSLLNPDDQGPGAKLPLLRGKTLVRGQPAVYICQNYACKTPVTSEVELERVLRQ
jgi:uncharacterized protein YyaL (SSP411 family)